MAETLRLQGHGRQVVTAAFDGEQNTSDGGGLLLREVEERFGVLTQLAHCFRDGRDPRYTEFSVRELLAQRVYALALGYEDLSDHDELRRDPTLALLVGRRDVTGADRVGECRGIALAGKSTLNRLELPATYASDARYKKIVADPLACQKLLVRLFIQSRREVPQELTIDFDATDDPLHGRQEGRFFHGYYDSYCYLPLYGFCGDFPLWAQLRSSDHDAAAGTVEALTLLVGELRAAWPEVKLTVRGDSGFCREHLMAWCEVNRVHFLLGLARNSRLEAELAPALAAAAAEYAQTRQRARHFTEFTYRTLDSWSRERRVIGKAEHLDGKANPRFIVTSLSATEAPAQPLYEQVYCARGEMENRIKEQQLYLFADRTSSYAFSANQLRLFFSTIAYTLLQLLREFGLTGTALAEATCETIRRKLLKLGGAVTVSCRRILFRLARGCPYADLFALALRRLQRC